MPAFPQAVLFVCTANICRSPTVEGVFRAAAKQRGCGESLIIDSAGTHVHHLGEPPDRRAVMSASMRGYDIAALSARAVTVEDFSRFNWILAMDRANLTALEGLRPPDCAGHLGLFLDLVPSLGVREVPDPYYGGSEGFERVLDLAEAGSGALLELLRAHRVAQPDP